jgi:hypothetical protein
MRHPLSGPLQAAAPLSNHFADREPAASSGAQPLSMIALRTSVACTRFKPHLALRIRAAVWLLVTGHGARSQSCLFTRCCSALCKIPPMRLVVQLRES